MKAQQRNILKNGMEDVRAIENAPTNKKILYTFKLKNHKIYAIEQV